MIVAWPLLAFLGMPHETSSFRWWMVPTTQGPILPFLCFTCLAFSAILVAFHNAPTWGLITLGDLVNALL